MKLKLTMGLTCLGLLTACGDSAKSAASISDITDVNSGISAMAAALKKVVPEKTATTTNSVDHGFGIFSSLEDVWNEADYAADGDRTLKTTIQNYFAAVGTDNSYSFRGRVVDTLNIPCVAAHYIGTNGLLLNVGTTNATFDVTNDLPLIQAVCPVSDDFFNGDVDGATPIFVVTNVSGEAGSLYNQKMTIDFDADASVDVVYYFKIESSVVRLGQVELNGGDDSKSSTYIEYTPSSGAIKAEYMTGKADGNKPVDEGLRLFSDGTTVNWFAYLFKDAGKSFIGHYTYLANSPSDMVVSVKSEGVTSDATDASACIRFSDYVITRDNTLLVCSTTGKAASTFDSFVIDTLTQTLLSNVGTVSSSRGVPFSRLTGNSGMYRAVQ